MSPQRWWSVILTMGLFMALSPLSAQAGPNRPFAPQPNRQAFTPPQACGNVFGQAHQGQPPRGNAYGWNGQNRQWQQPRGNAYGWNGRNRQWNQQRNADGRYDHQRQWDQRRNEYGRNDHRREWDQRRDAYRRNDHQGQWNQQRNAYGQNNHQGQWQQPGSSIAQGGRPGNPQFQPPNGGQLTNAGSSNNRAGYPAQPQSPTIAPSSSGYSHTTTIPAGQTGAQPGFGRPATSGNTPQPQSQSPSGVI